MEATVNKNTKDFTYKKAFGFGFNFFNYILNSTFISYLSYFATNSLYMSAASIGMVLLISKIFDGGTDLIAGVIIDKTRTRWGKARPYALFGIFAWICLVLVFCVPDFSDFGKTVYIFIFYNLNTSIFFTLVNVAKTLHLKRAIREEENRIKILTLSGILYSLGTVVLNVVFPIVVAEITGSQSGWIAIASVLAVIGIIGSVLCFFWCPEYEGQEDEQKEVVKKNKEPFTKYIGAVLKNRYIIMYMIIQFVTSLIAALSIGVGTYYFTYIVGDLKIFSIVSAVSIISFPVLPFIPKIVKKIGTRGCLIAGFAMGAGGALLRLIGYTNIPLLCIGNLITSFGLLPTNFVGPEIVIGCMTYSNKTTGTHAEAIFSSFENLALKIAAGIGSGALGLILAYVGFDGKLAVQSAFAISGINFLYNWIPIIFYGALLIMVIIGFDLEKKLKELENAD